MFFNSIQSLARREIKNLKRTNPTLNNYSLSPLHLWVIKVSNHPIRYASAIFLVAVLILLTSLWLSTRGCSYPIKLNLHFFPSLDFQGVLLTVQATIAALTFPILIGFIGSMPQGGHLQKTKLPTYLLTSGAPFVGLSSVFLVLFISGQLSVQNILPSEVSAVGGWINLGWFFFNGVGTIFFLYQTVQFLREDYQRDFVIRFLLNCVWIKQLKQALLCHHYLVAQVIGHMPGSFKREFKSREPNIYIYPGPGGFSGAQKEVIAKIEGRKVLSNVRLVPLRWIAKKWLKQSSTIKTESEEPSIFHFQDGPTLSFFLTPGWDYEGEVILCEREGGVPLRSWEKWIIRACFSFKKQVKDPLGLTIENAIQDFLSETLSAIDSRQKNSYTESLRFLNHFFEVLIASSMSSFQENNIKCYVELGDPFRFSNLIQTWLRNYRDLFVRTASILHEDSEYFEYAASIPKHLLIKNLGMHSPGVAEEIIRLARSAYYHLQVWWTRRAEEQGAATHNCSSGVELNPPYWGIYRSTLMRFVGSWEDLSHSFYDGSIRDEGSWEKLSIVSALFESHINNTLFMLMASIDKGDVVGANWMCDILQKWWVQKHFEKGHIVKRGYFLTLDCFMKDWVTIKEQAELRRFTNEPGDFPFKLFASALYNYWVDVCILSILILIDWGELKETGVPIALKVAKILINGELTHNEGNAFRGEIKPINSFENLLETFLRQRFQEEELSDKETYRKKLDSLLQRATDSLGKGMVAGRVYTTSGRTSLNSLTSSQIFLLCIFSPSQTWEPSTRLKDDINGLGANDDEITRNIIFFFIGLSQKFEEFEDSRWNTIYTFLKNGETGWQVEFSAAKQNTKRAIDLLKTFTEKLRDDRIRSAEIDSERIEILEKAFSNLAFNSPKASVPVAFFEKVEISDESFQEKIWRVSGFEKGKLTKPLYEHVCSDEEDLFQRRGDEIVSKLVMEDISRQAEFTTIQTSTPNEFWSELMIKSQTLESEGMVPILLVEGSAQPEWLWEWIWPSGDHRFPCPEGLNVQKRDTENHSSYVAHLNNIPAYYAPIPQGAALLVPRESLKLIRFSKQENGLPVKLGIEFEATELKATLKFCWRQKIELGPTPIIRLKYDVTP